MLNPDEIWFAEFSVQQGCFHIETAREAAENNLRQIIEGWTNGYIVFGICGSHLEAGAACDALAAAMLRHGGKPGEYGRIRMPKPRRRTTTTAAPRAERLGNVG